MKMSEIRNMSSVEIRKELDRARESLFNLKFRWATLQLRDHNLLKVARHDVARLETALRERELAGEA